MKVVLSRKGFDSQYGGMASPILPDARLVPLPIPGPHDTATFGDLNLSDIDVGALVADLSAGRKQEHALTSRVHLDPDLDRAPASRLPGWRPSLGQAGAAQGHLRNQGVGPGDVFLFFGWFRRVEHAAGRWRYRRDAPDLHVLFGWLEIEEVVPIVGPEGERERALARFPWLADHPHVAAPGWYVDRRNTVYVAPAASRFSQGAGGGRFVTHSESNQLTAPAAPRRGAWSLPGWFRPRTPEQALSHHADLSRWGAAGDRVRLDAVAKGQEFVLDAAHAPELPAWVAGLVKDHA